MHTHIHTLILDLSKVLASKQSLDFCIWDFVNCEQVDLHVVVAGQHLLAHWALRSQLVDLLEAGIWYCQKIWFWWVNRRLENYSPVITECMRYHYHHRYNCLPFNSVQNILVQNILPCINCPIWDQNYSSQLYKLWAKTLLVPNDNYGNM